MLLTTLPRLVCPRCAAQKKPTHDATLDLTPGRTTPWGSTTEVTTGTLQCKRCRSKFPILSGVAILVSDVNLYLMNHCKGIEQLVADSEIPREHQKDYAMAKEDLEQMRRDGMGMDEDLESMRVNALYVMNHYLYTGAAGRGQKPQEFWKPDQGSVAPWMDELVRKFWDQGPLAQIAEWIRASAGQNGGPKDVVELGCGVGGLAPRLKGCVKTYLGIDSAFLSVAIARKLVLGVESRLPKLRAPADFLDGPLSRDLAPVVERMDSEQVDFVVGDIQGLPARLGEYDVSVALNAIDMLDEPADLPRLQSMLLRSGGVAVQSSPYIWPDGVARQLRGGGNTSQHGSAQVVAQLYEKNGFQTERSEEQMPWLFFKQLRQLEIYSVHGLWARKK